MGRNPSFYLIQAVAGLNFALYQGCIKDRIMGMLLWARADDRLAWMVKELWAIPYKETNKQNQQIQSALPSG